MSMSGSPACAGANQWRSAEDGQEDVELCELAQPDVVLMDLIMPRMDRIEATRAIHQRWPHIHVLVLTSFTEKEMIQGAL